MSDQDRPRVRIHFPPIPEEQNKMLAHEWIKMVREGCRRGEPLLGSDAKLLEQVLTEVKHECDDAQGLAGEAWAAGVRLAGEMMESTDGWLVCLRDFGDLFLDCERAEKERDEARGEVDRLRKALEKAASTLEDTATDLRLLSRIDSC